MTKRMPNYDKKFRDKVLLSPEDEWIKSSCGAMFKARNSIYVEFYGDKSRYKSILSRFILNAPKKLVVDHINRDIFDNRRDNLRICEQKYNLLNKRSKIKYRGTRLDTRIRGVKKFQAYIQIDGRFKSLGYYETVEEAAIVRDIHAKKVHGQYAILNYVNKED